MSLPPDDRRPTLRPPQFGLRTLLAATTLLAGLFALSQWLEPVVIAALAFLGATISCHIAGNALGTRLRANGDRPIEVPQSALASPMQAPPAAAAPATHLSQRQSLGWTIVIAALGGVVAGGAGGGVWTLLASRGPVGPLNVAVGIVAFGVLGGLTAFATVGFVQVMLGAMWQAMKTPPRHSASEGGG